jgi:NAD(P)-dependent dehydrogenase (short-subunit alcohol dehydrogenase family)
MAMTRTQQTALAIGALAIGGTMVARGLRASRRMDFRGRSVVITGGSRGLGLVIARQMAREGARLTIAARNQEELERAQEDLAAQAPVADDIQIVRCDVGNRQEAERLINQAIERFGGVDVLVNNAGIIQVGPVEHMRHEDFERAMAVHFWGPLHTTLAAIPVMRRNGGGRIVNISSIGGKIGVPHLVPYCASKFALTGLSDALRGELAKDRIYVTTVCPGLMRTGSPFNAWFKGNHRAEFAWFVIADSMPIATIDARRAAAQVVDACRHGDAELVITVPAKLAIVANAVMPESMALMMSLTNSLLPPPGDATDAGMRSGWQSLSDWAPSRLTTLSDRAAAENNELPQ